MRHRKLVAIAALAFCCTLAGCGAKPYYKYEGPGEVKKLVVYKKDGGQITIPLGTAMGGGMWKHITKADVKAAKGPVVKTVETQGVKFTLTYNPGIGRASVKDVYYEGKQLKSW